MARIADCGSCGVEFYDSTEKQTYCNRCTRYKRETAEKLQRVKSFYDGLKRRGKFHLRFAVLNCIEREKLSITETAQVLERADETIKWEWDAILQDAS